MLVQDGRDPRPVTDVRDGKIFASRLWKSSLRNGVANPSTTSRLLPAPLGDAACCSGEPVQREVVGAFVMARGASCG